MPDDTSSRFFQWIDAHNIARDEAAKMIGVDPTSFSTYRSRGLPKKKLALAERLMGETVEKDLSAVVLRITTDELNEWARAYKDSEAETFEDWTIDAIRKAIQAEREAPPAVVPFQPKAHLEAAAGSPIGAEVIDWDGADDTVMVKINGLSMEPLLHDGDVVPFRIKKVSRSEHMAKGVVYLVAYDGGYTVKRYNTRLATPEEIEEGISYVSPRDGDTKVRVLESLNPDFPEIVIKSDLDWIGWLDR